MARPDNSVPPRPASVPAEARWDPKEPGFEWEHGELDAEGRRHGAFRSWPRGGALRHEERRDAHGEALSIAKYRPDGSLEKKTLRDVHGEQRELYGEAGQ